jgi:tape measure domain-containing protein
MSQPIDTASVAIVPDFSAFGREAGRAIEAALRDLVNDVRRALGQTERAAADAGNELGREFQTGGERAEAALREVSRTATTTMGNVERQASQAAGGMAAKLGGALGVLKTGLAAGGVAAAAGLGAITVFGLQAAAQLEQVQVAFTSLLGSAEKGAEVFKGLQQFAAETPFEFPEIAGAAQRFLAFNEAIGLTDDQLQPFLTTLGDIASVTGSGAEGLSRVTLALGQIASRGKVSLEELNQISEAMPGFSGVAAIAAAKGITTAEAMEQISAGAISAQEGVAALLQGMQTFPGAAGAMEKQAQTLLGVFSTFKDTLSQALVAGFEPVIPAIKDSLAAATPELGAAIAQLAPALGSALSAILPLITQIVQLLVPILKPLIDGVGVFVRTAGETGGLARLGEAIGAIAKALFPLFPVLGDIVAVLAEALIPVAEALAPVIAELAPAIVDIVTAFLPLVPVIGELTGAVLLLLVPLIQAIAAFVSWLSITGLLPLVTLLAEGVGFLASAIAEFAKWLGTIDWQAVGNAIGGAFTDAWEAVVAFFVGIGEWFDALPDRIGAALQALPSLLVAAAGRAFDAFFVAVGFGIGTIIKFFIDLPGNIATLVTLLWTTVVALTVAGITALVGFFAALPGRLSAFVADLWTRVKAFFTDGVTSTVDTAKSLPGRILDALKNLPDQLFNIGRNMILGLIDGVKATIGRAIETVKRAMGDIVDGAKAALGISSPSLVFAKQVGVQIPAGIDQGVQAGIPDLTAAINDAIQPPVAATSGQGVGALGNVVINLGGIHFAGVVPTEAEAKQTGAAAMAGALDALRRRDVALAVRQI